VHNQQVLDKLAKLGISIINSIDDLNGDIVAIGAHGVSPEVEKKLKARYKAVIDTTCPLYTVPS